jgi:trimeric autotransporter adhesin
MGHVGTVSSPEKAARLNPSRKSVAHLVFVLVLILGMESVAAVVRSVNAGAADLPLLGDEPATYHPSSVLSDSSLGGDERWSPEFPFIGAIGPMGNLMGGTVTCAVEHRRRLFVGGTFAYMDGVASRGLAAWDGNRWESFPDHGLGGPTYSLLSTGDALFVGGASSYSGGEANCLSIWDGARWSRIGTGLSARVVPVVESMTMYHDSLVAAGDFQRAEGILAPGVARWTGAEWQPMGSDSLYDIDGRGASVQSLVVFRDTLFALGSMRFSRGDDIVSVASWNGRGWVPRSAQPDGSVWAATMYEGELVIGGAFLHVGTVAASGLAAWDGHRWRELGAFSRTNSPTPLVGMLAVVGSDLFAAGRFDSVDGRSLGSVVALNGGEWRALNADVLGDANVWCMAGYGGRLVIGGAIRSGEPLWKSMNIAAWDGERWGPVGPDSVRLVGVAYGMTSVSDGVVAGGTFATPASEATIRAVGLRTDAEWTLLGGAFNSEVTELVAGQNDIYATGGFTIVDDLEVNRVSRYDRLDESWHCLGNGLSATGRALALYGGNPVVGGDFQFAGGVEVHGVASWNGSSWEALGSGFNGSVFDLVVFRGELYAFGRFTRAGSEPCLGGARWDGQHWAPADAGLLFRSEPIIDGSIVWGDRLVAFGDFETVSGVSGGDLASWNGSTWEPVLPALEGFVTALGTCDGRLVVGGRISNTVDSEYLVQYDGKVWWGMGTGVWSGTRGWSCSPKIASIAQHGDDLYVSGCFRAAGGSPSEFIARWYAGSGPVERPGVELHVTPNPVRDGAFLSWTYSGSGPVRIWLCDVEGRVVLPMTVTPGVTGPRKLYWKSIDRNGRALPSGIYFARLEAGGSSASAKVLVMRVR